MGLRPVVLGEILEISQCCRLSIRCTVRCGGRQSWSNVHCNLCLGSLYILRQVLGSKVEWSAIIPWMSLGSMTAMAGLKRSLPCRAFSWILSVIYFLGEEVSNSRLSSILNQTSWRKGSVTKTLFLCLDEDYTDRVTPTKALPWSESWSLSPCVSLSWTALFLLNHGGRLYTQWSKASTIPHMIMPSLINIKFNLLVTF